MGEMSFQVKVAEIGEDCRRGLRTWRGAMAGTGTPSQEPLSTLARPPPRGVTVGAALLASTTCGARGGAARSEALGQWLQSFAKLDPLCALGAGFTERCSDSRRASSVA